MTTLTLATVSNLVAITVILTYCLDVAVGPPLLFWRPTIDIATKQCICSVTTSGDSSNLQQLFKGPSNSLAISVLERTTLPYVAPASCKNIIWKVFRCKGLGVSTNHQGGRPFLQSPMLLKTLGILTSSPGILFLLWEDCCLFWSSVMLPIVLSLACNSSRPLFPWRLPNNLTLRLHSKLWINSGLFLSVGISGTEGHSAATPHSHLSNASHADLPVLACRHCEHLTWLLNRVLPLHLYTCDGQSQGYSQPGTHSDGHIQTLAKDFQAC